MEKNFKELNNKCIKILNENLNKELSNEEIKLLLLNSLLKEGKIWQGSKQQQKK